MASDDHGERLARLEEKVDDLEEQSLDARLTELETWAKVFGARLQTWLKVVLIVTTFVMSSQVPIVKEIVGILLK